MKLLLWAAFGALFAHGVAWSAESGSASSHRDLSRCRAGSVDACYDAIRWNPRDPGLLVALGDGLARAGRPVDAIRNYRRAASISPNFPGLSAKINVLDARLNAKHAPPRTATPVVANAKPAAKYTNAAPESESH
jgi:hypothetical protein